MDISSKSKEPKTKKLKTVVLRLEPRVINILDKCCERSERTRTQEALVRLKDSLHRFYSVQEVGIAKPRASTNELLEVGRPA